ncbi:TetR/AcrR family transcriptional regulator [Streptomyces palmae]|uniref:TetR/AcrR family transcriptional regulator n=1 Tax=Streptomyces palmae TaxID=1701085 RepID=A0A4Z0H5B5_9ACTN|nr:TetR/AcrR family transcriptional regulator [Streptomyces palmae]TGB06258.1 TetR/AcrR family transcriptional regulator [Streptomyces palmae]
MDEPPAEDLTARARIRNAALRLYAERGTEKATIREIAKVAGVSAGLVRHHFGSKEALREACDSYALEQIMDAKQQAVDDQQVGNVAFLQAVHPRLILLQRYLTRAMIDGSPAAATLFDRMVDFTEQWVALHNPEVTEDRRAYAAVLVAMAAGPTILSDQLSRVLGGDVRSPEGHLRMSRAVVDIHSHTLLSPELAAQAHATLGDLQAQEAPTGPRAGADHS